MGIEQNEPFFDPDGKKAYDPNDDAAFYDKNGNII